MPQVRPSLGRWCKFGTAASGFGAFSPSSALSDSTGTVTTLLTPASSTSNGADTAIAQATVAGVLATGSVGFSVTSSGSNSGGSPSISLSLSTATVTTATPSTVTAVVRDGNRRRRRWMRSSNSAPWMAWVRSRGHQRVDRYDRLGEHDADGDRRRRKAEPTRVVARRPRSIGTPLQASQGFQLTASSVTIASVTPDNSNLSAYGQTNIQVQLAGTIAGTPVTVSITSACIASGKATLTPASATTTNGAANFTYHTTTVALRQLLRCPRPIRWMRASLAPLRPALSR